MNRVSLRKQGTLALALVAGAAAYAADYTDTTGTYGVYSLSGQTDTWTRCTLTVDKLYLASDANSRAELVLRETTHNINGLHRIGHAGIGTYRAESNSLLQVGANVEVGYNGALYMTDSTGVVATAGLKYFDLGRMSGTGDLHLVRSKLYQTGGLLRIRAGWDSSGGKQGRLFATDSTLHVYDIICGYGDSNQSYPEGYFVFDHCSVTSGTCSLGGTPGYGQNRGFLLLTNSSAMTVTGNLIVGDNGGNSYECKLTADGSRLAVGGSTTIAKNGYYCLGGRVTLKNGAQGSFAGNVTVGVDYVYSTPSRGYLDVLSGSRLDITNAAGTAMLTVGVYGPNPNPGHVGTAYPGGYGRLTVSGVSTCRVDNLVATNNVLYGGQPCSAITFSGGLLSVKSGTIANGATTTIGDGANPATLDLWGRKPFNVTSNLVFSSNATLAVEIGGPTTNDCNYLDVHGTLTFHPDTAMDIKLVNGYEPGGADSVTVALADTLTTQPATLPDGYRTYIVDEGGRKALKINRPPQGTLAVIR